MALYGKAQFTLFLQFPNTLATGLADNGLRFGLNHPDNCQRSKTR